MNRRSFVKMLSALGFLSQAGCSAGVGVSKDPGSVGKVLVVGAGAAGLTAAHHLKQQGIEFQVLEASSVIGGRMKRTKDFADFPIPLGAEWLHTNRSILDEIIRDDSVDIKTVTRGYDYSKEYALIGDTEVSLKDLGFTKDQKFIGSTWYDFFETYVVPNVYANIQFNSAVKSIDYSQTKILIDTEDRRFEADKVILTVPVKLLKLEQINFKPALPKKKLEALNETVVWDGCKAFLEFSESFYPAAVGFEGESERKGHRLYYDAAYGQQTEQNVLGLFAVGSYSKPYIQRSGSVRLQYILDEIDELSSGLASRYFKKHIFQSWTDDPWARGAYIPYYQNWRTVRTLGESVEDRLFFAGDAYTDGEDWSSVHAAAQSAMRAVSEL